MIEYYRTYVRSLIKNEKGATAIEYGLLAALIAVAIVLSVKAVGGALNDTFSNVKASLPTN